MFTDKENHEVNVGDNVTVDGKKGRVESEMSQNVCIRLEDGSLVTPRYVDVLFDSAPTLKVHGAAAHGPLMTEEDLRLQAKRDMDLLAAREKKVMEHVVAPQQREELLNADARNAIEVNKEFAKRDTERAEESLKHAEAMEGETPDQIKERLQVASTQSPEHTPNPTTTPNKPGETEQPKPEQPTDPSVPPTTPEEPEERERRERREREDKEKRERSIPRDVPEQDRII